MYDEIDELESMEHAAEIRYFNMLQPDGKLKCDCGKFFNPEDGEITSQNPFALPVCPECFSEWMENQNA